MHQFVAAVEEAGGCTENHRTNRAGSDLQNDQAQSPTQTLGADPVAPSLASPWERGALSKQLQPNCDV